MLNKKTEYRLQYSKLDKELRKQIWQDNIKLRKSRLMSNQATHYWEYQLQDEVCDCENESDGDDDVDGPLPPHRQKHKHLRDQYKQQVEKLKISPVSLEKKDTSTVAVQNPKESCDEPDKSLDTGEGEIVNQMQLLTVPDAKDSGSRPPTPNQSKSPNPRECKRTTSLHSRPTRTSRKLISDGKKTHFAPFGWNEANTDVGHKLTYNVCAPEREVHDSAMVAAQRRKAEINLFLAQEKQKVKHHARPRERAVSSNSNNAWVSEYREQFSARSSRPVSAPPAPRHPVTWRHS